MPGFVTSLVVALAALGAALVLALFVSGSPAVAGSTDLVVTKTADTNDGACNSDCSLREAIIRSNTSGADAIEVPAGTYKLTIQGRNEDAAATGDLDIRRGVTIRGEGARDTIINGNGIDRVFHIPVNPPNSFTLGLFSVKITGGVSDFGVAYFTTPRVPRCSSVGAPSVATRLIAAAVSWRIEAR
jgi:CSLREA domain-containing protein